jgi:hypothetical protein
MHSFKINIITINDPIRLKHVYMENETFAHRRSLFNDYETFFKIEPIFKDFDSIESTRCLNTLVKKSIIENENKQPGIFLLNTNLEKSEMKLQKNAIIVDCNFKSCKLSIGENSYLSDLTLVYGFTIYLDQYNL